MRRIDGDGPRDDGQPTPDAEAGNLSITPKPDGEVPPGPRYRWCVFVGAWCLGTNCFCELTLFA